MPNRIFVPVFLFSILFVFFTSCGLLGGGDSYKFLKVTPISAVEVALEVTGYPGDEILIEREGKKVHSFSLNKTDTLIYETGLEPATTYTWQIKSYSSITPETQIAERKVTTLDSTSSNFTWQTFSFGEHSSSVLYGVSIIDEDNIWAVGEIYMNDSTEQADGNIYNVIHWDGEKWELLNRKYNCRLHFPNCGPVTNLDIKSSSIMGFNSSDIWITAGSAQNFDGESWTQHAGIQGVGNSNKIWGSDSNNVWFVGNNGFIVRKKNDSWQKIETGTELDFYDIHGNEKQGVVAIAAKIFESFDKVIYRINPSGKVQSLSVEGIPYPISGIWFEESGVAYIVGSGMYRKPDINSSLAWQSFHKNITNNYLQAIDGNGLNDIVAAGAFGELLHFNGAGWRSFYQGIDGNLYDIDLKDDFAAAAGYDGRQAYITIGKRE